MRPEEREALRRRFHFRCGYCGVSETDGGAELTVDHALISHRRSHRRQREMRQVLEESLRQQEKFRRRVEALEQAVAEAQRRLRSL